MPLHDWTNDAGWDGFHLLWIGHLFHHIKPRLPDEYRAYLGAMPALSVATPERPDVAVRHWLSEPPPMLPAAPAGQAESSTEAPDIEAATIVLDPQQALYVAYRGRLVAAVELISPQPGGALHAGRRGGLFGMR